VASGLHTDGDTRARRGPIHTSGDLSMAEIRVEPRRRSTAWLWVLVALVAVGGLIYYLLYHHNG